MMFSYFPYAAAFGSDDAGNVRIDLGLVGIALVIAPFVFVTVAFMSRHPEAPKRVMYSMALLIPLALAVGLLSPVLGATAGFGVGGAMCLRPLPVAEPYRLRIWLIVFTVVYTFVLLVLITPAGVFSGGLLPLLMVGFADEYVMWRRDRQPEAEA